MKNDFFRKYLPGVALIAAFILTGCGRSNDDEVTTRGSLTILTSDDLSPMMSMQIKEFNRVYDKATVTQVSMTAREAIVHLINDSVKMIVIPRELNGEELAAIKKYSVEVDKDSFAYDGIAVLVNEKNPVTAMTVEQLRGVLLKTIPSWKNVDAKAQSNPVLAALEIRTAVHEYIIKRITGTPLTPEIIYPCSTSSQLISVVSKNLNTIGFLPIGALNYLVDSFVTPSGTRILQIGDPAYRRDTTSKKLEYFPPHPAHIYRNYYPLHRTIYIYSHNANRGLSLGFGAFLKGNEGQNIVTSLGMVPATRKVRLVKPKN